MRAPHPEHAARGGGQERQGGGFRHGLLGDVAAIEGHLVVAAQQGLQRNPTAVDDEAVQSVSFVLLLARLPDNSSECGAASGFGSSETINTAQRNRGGPGSQSFS